MSLQYYKNLKESGTELNLPDDHIYETISSHNLESLVFLTDPYGFNLQLNTDHLILICFYGYDDFFDLSIIRRVNYNGSILPLYYAISGKHFVMAKKMMDKFWLKKMSNGLEYNFILDKSVFKYDGVTTHFLKNF